MRRLWFIATAVALAIAPAAHAGDFSYSYVEAGYAAASLDEDEVDADFDGFFLRGSVGVTDHFSLFASYVDVSWSGVDLQRYAVGVGGNYPLSDVVDVVGRVGWSRTDVSGYGFSEDDDGYLVSAGLRGRLGERFELEGAVTYEDYGGGSNDTSFRVGALYYFTEKFAIGAELEKFEDVDTWGVGFRLDFGD